MYGYFCTPDDGHDDVRNMFELTISINLNLSASVGYFFSSS
jgi:hypothetical protein